MNRTDDPPYMANYRHHIIDLTSQVDSALSVEERVSQLKSITDAIVAEARLLLKYQELDQHHASALLSQRVLDRKLNP